MENELDVLAIVTQKAFLDYLECRRALVKKLPDDLRRAWAYAYLRKWWFSVSSYAVRHGITQEQARNDLGCLRSLGLLDHIPVRNNREREYKMR